MATILIVDDVHYLRTLCRVRLEEQHLTVIEAANGREAVNQYRRFRPDGVLLDINMPVLNGLEALEEIRHFDPEARVAMLTALGESDMVMRAIQAGACDFILKPFSFARLTQVAEKLLERPGSARRTAEDEAIGVDEDAALSATAPTTPQVVPVRHRSPGFYFQPKRYRPVSPPPPQEVTVHHCAPTGRPCTFLGCMASQ